MKVEAKPALLKLFKHEDYMCERTVAVDGVWNVARRVGMGSDNPDRTDVLAENLAGSEDDVRKLAQEAFDFDQGNWMNPIEVVRAGTKMAGLTDVSKLLRECGISGKPIPNHPEE